MALYEAVNLFWKKFIEKVEAGENIFLVSSDYAAPSLYDFREKYPKNFVPVGIAEQSMIAVAAGLAMAGETVVAYTGAPFMAFRGFDQIRNCICLMNLPVMMISENTGYSISTTGVTHFVLEDLNILRGCANLEIVNISDKSLTEFMAERIGKITHPVYMRFDRFVERDYGMEPGDYSRGFRILHRPASHTRNLLLTTGTMVSDLLDILRDFPEEAAETTLVDVFRFPFDEDAMMRLISGYERLVTVEEMLLQGGLGSAILEAMADCGVMKPVKRLGVDVRHGYPERYGSREYHLAHSGLSREEIIAAIRGA